GGSLHFHLLLTWPTPDEVDTVGKISKKYPDRKADAAARRPGADTPRGTDHADIGTVAVRGGSGRDSRVGGRVRRSQGPPGRPSTGPQKAAPPPRPDPKPKPPAPPAARVGDGRRSAPLSRHAGRRRAGRDRVRPRGHDRREPPDLPDVR